MASSIIAQQFRCHVRTIERLQNRFRQTRTTSDRPRPGRPRVTTRCQDRHIRTTHLRNRFISATVTARTTPGTHNQRISDQTVTQESFKRNRFKTKTYLRWSKFNFATPTQPTVHQRWRLLQWRNILFSEESRFCLERRDGRVLVYRRRNERYADACVMERDQFGGGSVIVLGGITYQNCTRLIPVAGTLTAVKYRDDILAAEVLPFINANPHVTFQQDNYATSHTARVTRDFMNTNNVNTLSWPSISLSNTCGMPWIEKSEISQLCLKHYQHYSKR